MSEKMIAINVKLPVQLLKDVDEYAKTREWNRAQLIRWALRFFLNELDGDPEDEHG